MSRGCGIGGRNRLDVRQSRGALYFVGVFSRYLRTELFEEFTKSHSKPSYCMLLKRLMVD